MSTARDYQLIDLALVRQQVALEVLIRDSCHCYAAGEGWLHAARRERDLISTVGDAVRLQEQTLNTLVRAATDGLGLSKGHISVLHTFCDFPFWKSLVDAGMKRSEVADVIVGLALSYLKKHVRKRD